MIWYEKSHALYNNNIKMHLLVSLNSGMYKFMTAQYMRISKSFTANIASIRSFSSVGPKITQSFYYDINKIKIVLTYLWCLILLPKSENFLSQYLHLYGFSPVWHLIWRLNSNDITNPRPHILQLYIHININNNACI